jgi:hypothetical protein
MVLALRLLLAPALVVAASLAARRWGPRVGGVVAGLPVVGGPILLVLALAHGERFGARASGAALLGLVSLSAFLLCYAWLSARLPWFVALPAGWATFLGSSAGLDLVRPPLLVSAAVLALALVATSILMPRAARSPGETSHPPWDLPLRAAAAAAMVLALTAAAGELGPHLSGLLAPFPVVATVLAAFAHAQSGHATAVAVARGIVAGLPAFGLFCLIAAALLEELGAAAAFGVATVAALIVQAGVLALGR